MKSNSPTITANYITAMVKSIGKDLNYALSIVVWYTNTDEEQNLVEELIIKKF